MKAQDLTKFWNMPDSTRLCKKPTSVRLSIDTQAKIMALSEIYSNKTKSQLINDLLFAALEDVQKGIPSKVGNYLFEEPSSFDKDGLPVMEYVYQEVGLIRKFIQRTNVYIERFEKDIGNNDPVFYVVPEHVVLTSEEHNIEQNS